MIKEAVTGKVIADMSGDNRQTDCIKRRKRRTWKPTFRHIDNAGSEICTAGTTMQGNLEVKLELKVIADVGLIGFPNVGKSTLLIPCDKRGTQNCQLPFYNIKSESGCSRS